MMNKSSRSSGIDLFRCLLVYGICAYHAFFCCGHASGAEARLHLLHRKLLSFGQFCRLLLKAPQYGARKLMRFSALFESKKAHDDYNEQGDSLEWHKKKMRLPFPSLTKTVSRSQFTGQVMPYIEGFVASCRSRGASVVFLPPVYERTSYEHSKGFIEAIVESLAERQLPFIAAPIRYAFPDEEFADTNYHLNGRGVPRRVRYIAEDLKPKILASLNK